MGKLWRRAAEAWRKRLDQRITKAGLSFTLAVLLTGAAAFLSANNLIFLITSALLATLLVSGLVNRLSLAGLEVEFQPPEHLFAGEQAMAKLVVRNDKSWMPSFATRLQSIHADGLVQPLFFSMIAGGEAISEYAAVRFSRRGRFRDNSLEFTSRFPFGFAERRARVTLHADVLVYPALQPQPYAHDFLAQVEGEVQARRGGAGDDFYRLRPYTMTDAARRIDWRSSARHGELYVRENAQDDSVTVHIVLDLYVGEAGMPWLERALETSAWLCSRLEESNVPYSLRTQERTIAVPHDGDLYTVLRYLAVVEPTPFGEKHGLEAALPGDGDGLVIVLTADSARVPAGTSVAIGS
ncbi:MAG TPA: DUF58 domain-containing protein [Bryobacteraceae bacterium]|nr:DUF58 domain-containing protein [Bryobacteraceae bacterium]